MEPIIKIDGKYYYGSRICSSADEAYRLFRAEYHGELGRRVYKRLDASARKERVHGFHTYYSESLKQRLYKEFGEYEIRVPVYILGISGISYCYGFDSRDCPDFEEEKFFRWVDWALLNYGTVLKLKGRKSRSGRTSKRLKARYR